LIRWAPVLRPQAAPAVLPEVSYGPASVTSVSGIGMMEFGDDGYDAGALTVQPYAPAWQPQPAPSWQAGYYAFKAALPQAVPVHATVKKAAPKPPPALVTAKRTLTFDQLVAMAREQGKAISEIGKTEFQRDQSVPDMKLWEAAVKRFAAWEPQARDFDLETRAGIVAGAHSFTPHAEEGAMGPLTGEQQEILAAARRAQARAAVGPSNIPVVEGKGLAFDVIGGVKTYYRRDPATGARQWSTDPDRMGWATQAAAKER